MINTRQIRDLPSNLDAFIHEIGGALNYLYGPKAVAAYKRTAHAGYAQLFLRPEIRVWAGGGAEPDGLLVTLVRAGIGHITLLHTLADGLGKGIEDALLGAAIQDLRKRGVRAIIAEFVRHRPLNVASAFEGLDFDRINRQLMMAGLEDPRLAQEGPDETVPCEADGPAARVLVDAYTDHPSRCLHPEAQDVASAAAFLEMFRKGGYGATTPAFYRACPSNGECAGIIAGAEAAPDIGFILHVATARKAQGQGIGARLIREIAEQFRRAGYSRIGLGVTCGNPAERLYERLGFEHLAPVETYIWWADRGPRRA